MDDGYLLCSGLPAEELQDLTFEMVSIINEETDLDAAIPEGKGRRDQRGDVVTLGQILLTALSSGTVVALFKVLKPYFERKPMLKIELQRKDGEKMLIQAQDINKSQMHQTIEMTKSFLEGR